jgi:hypothetical protein
MRVGTPVFALLAVIAISDVPSASHGEDVFPDFDISANCKTDLPDSAGTGETLSKCTSDEWRAKQQLARQWSRFASDDKATCIKETGIDSTPSYVELQVCLEIASDNDARTRRGLGLGNQMRSGAE